MGKLSNDDYISKANKIIYDFFSYHKEKDIKKLYDAYNGVKDEKKYKHIEDNYGLGNAESVEFIPLIKSHVDVLLGEYLSYAKIANVSCKDSSTLNNINRDKQLKIASSLKETLDKKLQNDLYSILSDKEINDPIVEKQLEKIKNDINQNFISEYEIASQNVIDYILTSNDIDIETKLRNLAFDVLVTGQNYFIAHPNDSGEDVSIEVINPCDVYVEFNPNSNYVKDCTKAVIRRKLPINDILVKYHEFLTKEDKDRIKNHISNTSIRSNSIEYLDIDEDDNYFTINQDYLSVYEVQWLDVDEKGIMQRHEVIRIGSDIFVIEGKVENPLRSSINPNKCHLTLNGVYFLNRNNKPFSMVESCIVLQEKYNLLHFYRDNLIAQSGTKGNWVDMSLIPTFLGNTPEERLIGFKSYMKHGVGLIDTSQEGRTEESPAILNTIFNGFDNTLNLNSIQGIHVAMQNIERSISNITGVFQERLNGIEHRDAVTNVKLSVNNSHNVTKHYYDQFDKILREILIDALNVCKSTYKNGLKGVIVLGENQSKVFTALPEHFTLTDQDIRVISTSDIIKEITEIKANIPMLIQSNFVDSEILIEIMGVKSLTDLKIKLQKYLNKKKEEMGQLQQLVQQNGQLTNENKELRKKIEELINKVQKAERDNLELERQKQANKFKVDWYNAQTQRMFKEKTIEIGKERNNLEYMQNFDDNPYNDTIRKT